MSLLQWHSSSMQWLTYSHRSTHQWIDSPTRSCATSEPASMTRSPSITSKFMSLFLYRNLSVSLLQWHRQSDDLLTFIALSISESIRQLDHVQIVSLLQWHLSSMQWFIYSHRSTYQWIDLSTRSRATSEPATMTFSMRWSTRPHRSTHQWTWSNVHVQLVSLLQWRAQSRSLRWASRLVSLLQWHDHLR